MLAWKDIRGWIMSEAPGRRKPGGTVVCDMPPASNDLPPPSTVFPAHILIVAGADSSIAEHVDWLERWTLGTEQWATLYEVHLRSLELSRPSIVMVDLDMFQDFEQGLDVIMRFRLRALEPIIAAFSSVVPDHDLTASRADVADAFLRLPISKDDLMNGLSASVSNHRKFLVKSRRA